jgi:hypothetical protein
MIHHAWVRIPGHRAVPCTIISQSAKKALITFSERAPAAHEFKLQMEGSKSEVDCEVYYRKPTVLGVRLLEK